MFCVVELFACNYRLGQKDILVYWSLPLIDTNVCWLLCKIKQRKGSQSFSGCSLGEEMWTLYDAFKPRILSFSIKNQSNSDTFLLLNQIIICLFTGVYIVGSHGWLRFVSQNSSDVNEGMKEECEYKKQFKFMCYMYLYLCLFVYL